MQEMLFSFLENTGVRLGGEQEVSSSALQLKLSNRLFHNTVLTSNVVVKQRAGTFTANISSCSLHLSPTPPKKGKGRVRCSKLK